MARLNEVPASTESIESLKRRFVRQNREIARANSVQSTRVRDLETEVSRLLAENVSLREEVITLNQELEKYQGSARIDAGVSKIKEKLETKLAEVSNIVNDLGTFPRRCRTVTSPHPFSVNNDHPVLPTDNAGTPSARPVRDAALGSCLPAILEDKLYPRLSLEEGEDVDPVESFEVEQHEDGQTMYKSDVGPERQASPSLSQDDFFTRCEPEDGNSTHIPESPPSLEMRKRRKRRDSSLLEDIIPKAEFDPNLDDSTHAPRAGSKRKFSVSHDQEPSYSHQNIESDDFEFTRVTEQPTQLHRDTSPGSDVLVSRPNLKQSDSQRRKNEKPKTIRRALGPKSTNIDPKSPSKRKATPTSWSAGEKENSRRDAPEKPKRISKSSTTEPLNNSGQAQPKTADIRLIDDSPKSQGNVGDISSDKNIEPRIISHSPRVQELPSEPNDIPPPPPDLGTSVSDERQNDKMRHSRRSRGPVNYAEPNLRVKMRRPAEEPADAAGEDGTRRLSKSHRGQGSKSGSQQATDYEVKGMNAEKGFYTSEDEAPVGQQAESAHWGERPPESKVPKDRKGNAVPETNAVSAGVENLEQSPSSLVISTLVAGTKRRPQDKRHSSARAGTGHQQFPVDSFEESSIFSDTADNSADVRTLRQSRRHSSKPSYNPDRGPTDPRRADRKHAEKVSISTTEDSGYPSDNSMPGNYQTFQGITRDTHRSMAPDTSTTRSEGGRAQRLGTRRRTTMV